MVYRSGHPGALGDSLFKRRATAHHVERIPEFIQEAVAIGVRGGAFRIRIGSGAQNEATRRVLRVVPTNSL